jgi:hypothetical protein
MRLDNALDRPRVSGDVAELTGADLRFAESGNLGADGEGGEMR